MTTAISSEIGLKYKDKSDNLPITNRIDEKMLLGNIVLSIQVQYAGVTGTTTWTPMMQQY